MERYGYVVSNAAGFGYTNPNIYKNFSECVESVLREEHCVNENFLYFKFLKNADVVKMIHEKNIHRRYGYCYLLQSEEDDKLSVYNAAANLDTDLLTIVYQAKRALDEPIDVCGSKENKLKIGYFRILTDDEFVSELHATR